MFLVCFRLFLYRFGLCGVDVTDLVKIFDLMRLELRRLVPADRGGGRLNPPEFPANPVFGQRGFSRSEPLEYFLGFL